MARCVNSTHSSLLQQKRPLGSLSRIVPFTFCFKLACTVDETVEVTLYRPILIAEKVGIAIAVNTPVIEDCAHELMGYILMTKSDPWQWKSHMEYWHPRHFVKHYDPVNKYDPTASLTRKLHIVTAHSIGKGFL